MKQLYVLSIFILFAACQQKAEKSNINTENLEIEKTVETTKNNAALKSETLLNTSKTITTATNNIFKLDILPKENGLIDLAIAGKNFEFPVVDTLKNIYPIEKTFTSDLDEDGFDELYIISKSKDELGKLMLFGFASYKDKSFGSIYIPDLEASKELPFGYKGQDSINLIDNTIVRSFPIYTDESKDARQTGETFIITYQLIKGEANFILEPTFEKKAELQ